MAHCVNLRPAAFTGWVELGAHREAVAVEYAYDARSIATVRIPPGPAGFHDLLGLRSDAGVPWVSFGQQYLVVRPFLPQGSPGAEGSTGGGGGVAGDVPWVEPVYAWAEQGPINACEYPIHVPDCVWPQSAGAPPKTSGGLDATDVLVYLDGKLSTRFSSAPSSVSVPPTGCDLGAGLVAMRVGARDAVLRACGERCRPTRFGTWVLECRSAESLPCRYADRPSGRVREHLERWLLENPDCWREMA
jgi:hypothetical protein